MNAASEVDLGPVVVDRQGRIVVMTVNRPHVRNAFDRATAWALATAVDEFEADDEYSVGIITGAGGSFCSGMDLKAFVDAGPGERPAELEGRGFGGVTELRRSKPLIAAVEGYALAGGCELALACDLIVAAADARFGLPEITRGLVAGSGGLLRLPQRIPRQIAMEYALTGAHMTAAKAHRWGLVNRVTSAGQALDAAIELAEQIAANAPGAIRATKQIIDDSAGWSLTEAWGRQRELVDRVLASADAAEGARAFAEKRAPKWSGR